MNTSEMHPVPDEPTASDMLKSIFAHSGPYVSVYLATMPLLADNKDDLYNRWKEMRQSLETKGASLASLDAVEARIVLPIPEDAAGICVIAAAEGSTVVDYGMEPPRSDLAIVDTLPYSAPLMEWQQRRVPHLVVTVDEKGADVVSFGLANFTNLETYQGSTSDLLDPISKHVEAIKAKLVVLAGDPKIIKTLANELVTKVPMGCRIVTDSTDKSVDDLSEATVRFVGDTVARKTLNYLKEQQFLSNHDAAVDGTANTVKAISEGTAEVLLIHDDPVDQRRLSLGTLPFEMSLEERPGYTNKARIIDALIASAVLQNIVVRIIPSTGEQGPEDDVAALTRTDPEPPSI